MHVNTPDHCAHGFHDTEYCHECALLARADDGEEWSLLRKVLVVFALSVAAWAVVATVGVLIGKAVLAWLGVVL